MQSKSESAIPAQRLRLLMKANRPVLTARITPTAMMIRTGMVGKGSGCVVGVGVDVGMGIVMLSVGMGGALGFGSVKKG